MFTKPVGEDDASQIVSALGKGAERIGHARGTLEKSFGLKLSVKGLIVASLVAVSMLRTFVPVARAAGPSVSMTGAALLLGFPAISLIGRFQRHREAAGETLSSDVPLVNACLRLLHPAMWLASRWWGRVFLFLAWPFIFVGLHGLIFGLLPILIGALAFWLLWTVGNRLLGSA